MQYLGVSYERKHAPKLDPGFIPFGVWMNAYLQGATQPIAIAVERNDGQVSVRHAKIYGTPEMAKADLLAGEKETLGFFVSGHPVQKFEEYIKRFACVNTAEIAERAETGDIKDNDMVCVVGMVEKVRTKSTKSEQTMAFVELEDVLGSINVLVFPKVFDKFSHALSSGKIIKIGGRLAMREDRSPEIICESVAELDENDAIAPPKAAAKVHSKVKDGLYLRVKSEDSAEFKRAMKCIEIFDGSSSLCVQFTQSGRVVRDPDGIRVDVNPTLLAELRKILGNENVKYIERGIEK